MADDLTDAGNELRELAKLGLRHAPYPLVLKQLDQSPVLGRLPEVVAAGPDEPARVEYLIRAIRDAIDHLASPAVEGFDNLAGSPLAGEVLRILFDLGDSERPTAWTVRQKAAAERIHVSWDHFRSRRQGELLWMLARCMLAGPGRWQPDPVTGPSGGDTVAWSAGDVAVFSSQLEIEGELLAYIKAERPRQAMMLEHSTATSLSLIHALRDVRCRIRLLTARPNEQRGDWQSERLLRSLAELRDHHGDYGGLQWKMYAVPPSLRGRIVGSLAAVGWYTYKDNLRLPPDDPAATEVWGHNNALVVGHAAMPHGRRLADWFQREFDRLWEHRLTRPAADFKLA